TERISPEMLNGYPPEYACRDIFYIPAAGIYVPRCWNIEFSLTNEGNHRGVCMKCQDTPAEKACRILSSGMDAVRNGHTKKSGKQRF
ncbi:hypothetical protein, partial [Phocaeicola plebeius]